MFSHILKRRRRFAALSLTSKSCSREVTGDKESAANKFPEVPADNSGSYVNSLVRSVFFLIIPVTEGTDMTNHRKDNRKERLCQFVYQFSDWLIFVFQCVVIGAGPCGLRTAVELSFMGARVVLLEKRDSFSRNNVLHLWPFTIHDLRGLGAKMFYGKFCAGSIDHISKSGIYYTGLAKIYRSTCQHHLFPVCRYPTAAAGPAKGCLTAGG